MPLIHRTTAAPTVLSMLDLSAYNWMEAVFALSYVIAVSLCCYSLSKCIYSDGEEAEQESGASEIGHCRPVHICIGTCQSLM